MIDHKRLMQELKTRLHAQFGTIIRDVVLFGSQAAGTARADSDYDVLIVLNRAYDWQFRDQVIDALYDLELQYDLLIDAFLISTQELRHSARGAQPVFRNALQSGVYA